MFNIVFHKNIMEIEEKVAVNMTWKQIICLALGVAIDVPVYIFGKELVGADTISWVAIAIGAFFAAVGFYNNNGMTLIEFAKVIYENTYKTKPRSTYRNKEISEKLIEEAYKEKIAEYNKLKGEKNAKK